MKVPEKETEVLIVDAQTGTVISFSSNLESGLKRKIRKNEKPPFAVFPGEFQFELESDSGPLKFKARTMETEWQERRAFLILLEEMSKDIPEETSFWELEEIFQSLLSALPGMVYRCENDPQWTLRFVSKGSKELTGYEPEELLENRAVPYNDLTHPDYRQRLWEEWQRVLNEGKPFEEEYPIITRNGQIKWVWEKGRGVYTREGKLLLEGFMIDITARREMQEQLRKREQEYRRLLLEFRALLDAIPDNLTLQTPDLKIVWANRGAAAGINKEVPELIGRHCYELWHGRKEPCLVCPVQRAFQSGKMEEDTVTTPDGRVWFLRGIPIKDEQGKVQNVVEMGRDITSSFKAQRELQESEEKFRTLFNLVPDGIFIEDEKGNVLECNLAGARLYGYTPSEIIGKNIRHLVPEEFARTLPEVICEDSGGVFLERRSKRKDGSIFPSEIATRFYEIQGQRRLIAFVRDITERKRGEEALRLERDKAQQYLNIAGVIIVVLDSDGKVSLINKRGCEVLGYPEEEIVGRNWFEAFIPARVRSEVRATFAKLMSEEMAQAEYFENHMVTRNGKERLIAWQNAVLRDHYGKPMGTLSSGEDITEKRQVSEALRESEEKYRTLVENLSEGVDIVDSRENFIFANPACERIFGVSPGGLLGRNIKEFLPPESSKIFEEETGKRKRGISSQYEVCIRRENGEERDLLVSGVPRFGDHGKFIGTMAIISDITEKKRLEKKAEQARSDFLFAVSHELKTPLFLMATAQEMISTLPPGKRPERFLEYEELWNRNLFRLKILIDNLVDAQRREITGLKLSPQKVRLQPLLEQALEDLKVLTERKEIRFIKHLDALPAAEVDPEAIIRVLHNLLSNAIKFSFPKGEIEVSLKEKEGMAEITVRDQGSGIEPEILPYLFQPFTRAPEALKSRIPGTGLGLYVSKVLVEAHKGKIELQSDPGKGTTVIVLLPLPQDK